jgi:hypothetical protein
MEGRIWVHIKPAFLTSISFLILACLCNPLSLLPSETEPVPDTDADPPKVSIIENDSFTIVQLLPANGDLEALLQEHAQLAIAQGRKPFVEWDAEW